MKAVDIRVLNGREYDLNSYTNEARDMAVHLFAEYDYLLTCLDVHKQSYRASWIFENNNMLDTYMADKHRLQVFLERTEKKLMDLRNDPKSYKGITFKKLYKPIDDFFSSRWYFLFLGLFYAVLTVECIVREAPYYVILMNSLIIALLIFFFIKYSNKKGVISNEKRIN